MRRLFLALLLCLTISFDAYSQDSVASLMPNGMPSLQPANSSSFSGSILGNIPVLGGLVEEKILLNPFAMIGYQKTGVNMTVPMNVDNDPFPNITDAHLKLGSIDVNLEDFNFWFGTAGLNVILSPRLTLFGSVSGYLPKTFLEYGRQPVSFGPASASYEFTMTGHGLELWNIQCGLSIGVIPGYSVLLGSLWQHTSMKFEDMRVGSLPVNSTLKQDFMLKNWAPFVGLQYLAPGSYRASVIYSPLVTSWGNLKSYTTSPRITTLTYTLNQPGYLFGVTGEYFIPVAKTTTLSVWLTGAASVISGDSEAHLESASISLNRTARVLNISQYSLGGGFTLGLTF